MPCIEWLQLLLLAAIVLAVAVLIAVAQDKGQ